MFRNYLLTGIRNLWKNKSFSAINILGLSIGMASAILILLWVQHEMSYDRFHEKQSQLYMTWNRGTFDGKVNCWEYTPKILGRILKEEYPEIREMSRMNAGNTFLASISNNNFHVTGSFVDTGFLSMFSFPLVKGNPATALKGTNSIVLTEKVAKKLFGNEDPIGKTFKLNQSQSTNLVTVTGVLKDLPNNTILDFEFLLPWDNLKQLGWDDEYWGNNSVYTAVELKPGTNLAAFNEKVKQVTITHSKKVEDNEVFLYPFSRMRLYGKFENGIPAGGRIELVKLFTLIAVLILLIACINFMNLSTARSEKRAKEVGIRKVVGAMKQSLVAQFLGESLLLSLIAACIALVMVQFSLPGFNQLTGKQLFIPFGSGWFWMAALAFILITGIIAGSYPAFYLSSFRPIQVLKGAFQKVHALVTPRKLLVIIQFTIAIVLIVSTIVIKQQILHAQERYAGYDKSNLGYVFLEGGLQTEKSVNAFRQELMATGAVASLSLTSAPFTETWSNSWAFEWKGKPADAKIVFDRFCADQDIVKTAGFQLVQGRDLNLREYPTDSLACLLNESAVKAMGFKEPIGQIIKDNGHDWHVIGVINDFIIGSPYKQMRPMVIEGMKGFVNVIHMKLSKAGTTAGNLKKLEQVYKKFNPDFPFTFHFTDQEYANKFNDEQQIGTLAGLFAGLTIFISCLGLFGLATYMAENRTKEIGVRKVLGASVVSITTLLSKDFLKLVVVSLLIATPIAWWAMSNWLSKFSYRVTLQWWVFAGAGIIAILIALLTVSYKSVRAAMANPVKSLRTE